MNATSTPVRATLDDLFRLTGKAELIGGSIVRAVSAGHRPNLVAGRIFRGLASYADESGRGQAYTDGMGFAVSELPSGRESFSPDASYATSPPPTNPMRFVDAPPDFAVEVRSEHDYGQAAEEQIAVKREDYFAAGTLVVWDVDPLAEVILCYRFDFPHSPRRFGRGDQASAEPAVPGWRVAADWIFA